MDTAGNYHFNIGALRCVAVSDGDETVPVDSVIKDVPPELVNRALLEQRATSTALPYYFNCLYIQTGQHRILVDAGWGQGTQRRNGKLLERLQMEGISPADIDTVIITHGDVDHIGGLATSDHRVVFSNANYILLKEAWDFWSNERLVAKWPEPLTVFGRVTLPLIGSRVQVVEAGVEFLPGFQLLPASGHRPGHTAVKVASSGEHLVHLADTVGHILLMEHPAWHCAYDFRPEQAVQDRTQILNQAAAQQALLFGAHLPYPGVGHITAEKDGWHWEPLA